MITSPLHEMTGELTDVAMGRKPADTVIRGGKLVNVNTGEILPQTDVAICKGRIALVGDASGCIGDKTEVVDAANYYLTPGFLDGHVHVESSMVTLSQFAKTVLPWGTTGIFMDPHEIANVLGLAGVALMVAEGEKLPLKVFTTIPSCVPAAFGFEDTGADLTQNDIEESLNWPSVPGLGEMMNYPGVILNDAEVHKKIAATLRKGKVVTGHYASPETGRELQAYAASGCSSCHESSSKEEALAKMRAGMYAMIREGSAWQDVREAIRSITETGIDTRMCILVSDDTHPEALMSRGHLNHVVKRAIDEGADPVKAIQMVTLNVAQYFNKTVDLGSISPGKCADILFLKDLKRVEVERVYINGRLAAAQQTLIQEIPAYPYPADVKNSVRLQRELLPSDFQIKAPKVSLTEAKLRAILVQEAQAVTESVHVTLPVKEGLVQTSGDQDIVKLACVERHHATGTMALGVVQGFGIRNGAVASTVAHDSHNLLIMGTNDADMALAGNILAREGGGMVVVQGGKALALLKLPIGGLMSDMPVKDVRDKVLELSAGWRTLGCTLESPFMTLSLLSLPVIPKLRLTNRGLVDAKSFKFVDLFVEAKS